MHAWLHGSQTCHAKGLTYLVLCLFSFSSALKLAVVCNGGAESMERTESAREETTGKQGSEDEEKTKKKKSLLFSTCTFSGCEEKGEESVQRGVSRYRANETGE